VFSFPPVTALCREYRRSTSIFLLDNGERLRCRFQHKHLIGDRFFPADDYLAQSGVEAMMPGIELMGGGGEEMFIEDTQTGLQPVFEAKIGAIDWGAMAPSKDEYDSDDDGGSMGTAGYGGADVVGGLGGLENFVETSKKAFRRDQKQVGAPRIHFCRPFSALSYYN
jgi:hypothetical protein